MSVMTILNYYLFYSISNKLLALAKYEQNVYSILLLIVILLIYLLIQPIITWFITMHSVRLLTYLFSSFILILSLFLLALLNEKWGEFIYYLLQITFESIAFFGGILFVYYLSKRFIGKSKMK